MWKLIYDTAAQEDILNIATYIFEESRDIGIAEQFVEQLKEKCRVLARSSFQLGRQRPELRHDLRSSPYESYVIFFRYVGDTLEIVNILEGHRDLAAFYEGD